MKWALIMGLVLTGCVMPRGFPPNGIQNFDRVDAALYRGAQPSVIGLESLAARGVKAVVNLRDDPMPGEAVEVERLGMTYIHAPLSGVTAPSRKAVNSILAAIADAPKPVFVHCQYGCERTGMIVACYRIRNGWTTRDALSEADTYGMSDWAVPMREFILKFK